MNAYHRAKSYQVLDAQAKQIAIHILLLISYPDSTAVDHWKNEISAMIERIKRFRYGKSSKYNYDSDEVKDYIRYYLTEKIVKTMKKVECKQMGPIIIDKNQEENYINMFVKQFDDEMLN